MCDNLNLPTDSPKAEPCGDGAVTALRKLELEACLVKTESIMQGMDPMLCALHKLLKIQTL